MIYFIRGGDLVKIGKAKDVAIRLRELQRKHPEELRVIITIPGNEKQERKLHARFEDRRVHGEWFNITDDEVIAAATEFSADESNYPAFTPSDYAGILSATLALAEEAGLMVGVRNADANAKRPDGLMVYIAGLRTDGAGAVFAPDAAPTPTEAAA